MRGDAEPQTGTRRWRKPVVRFAAVLRAGQWWEHKLVPVLAVFYGAALSLGVPLADLWRGAVTLLLALIPGAAFVSLLNDWADRDEDLAAGKANRLAGRSPVFVAAALAVPVFAGSLFCWAWRDAPSLLAVYLAAWTAFTLYSLPPARLKARGFAGVLADAAGAHVFPSLLAALLAFWAADTPPDLRFLAATAAWAGAYGVRGILWHQLVDAENDRAAGVRTFVQRRDPGSVDALARRVVFPAEFAALLWLLWLIGSALPLAALALYGWLVKRRLRIFRMEAVIVRPRPRYLIWLHEYYDVFLPLALLVAAALAHRGDLLVLAAHLALFPRRAAETARDAWRLRRG